MSDLRKRSVAAAFGAATGYDAAAGLQRRVADRLAERLAGLALPARPRLLEIGCGTGFLSHSLRSRIGPGEWLLTDLSAAMVARCRASLRASFQDDNDLRFLVMDGERPCLAPGAGASNGAGFDLICASLAFQWLIDLGAALPRLTALLAPGGRLGFATLAEGTLAEWRAAHTALGLVAGVPDYPSPATLQSLWPAGGEGRIDTETIRCHHPDARDFLAGLKAIGAHTPAPGHAPLAPGALRRVLRQFDHPDGVTVSWQIAYGLWTRVG